MKLVFVAVFFFFDEMMGILEVFNDIVSIVLEKRQLLMEFERVRFVSVLEF